MIRTYLSKVSSKYPVNTADKNIGIKFYLNYFYCIGYYFLIISYLIAIPIQNNLPFYLSLPIGYVIFVNFLLGVHDTRLWLKSSNKIQPRLGIWRLYELPKYITYLFLVTAEKFANTNIKIAKSPGYYYILIARLTLPKKTCHRIIEPSILDMQIEYFEALQHKKYSAAKWIKIRYFFVFVTAIIVELPIAKLLEIKDKL